MLGSREAAAASGSDAGAGPQRPRSRAHTGGETSPGRARSVVSGLVRWKQSPCRTLVLFAAANTMIWFMAFGTFRAYSLLAILLALLVVTVTAKDIICSKSRGAHLWRSMTTSWEIIDPGQEGRSGTGLQLSDSLKLFIQEMSAFKQQNPGKFCLLVCSLCTFFAVLGRYIPGIIISYVLVVGVFLWPLISFHAIGLWLEPVLQKLDFGIGELFQKIKDNHEKRLIQAQTEKENVESDLSSMFPKLDSAACKEMSVSDTSVSDVTWTDNGTFNLSEGHTPQTENSEDLDKEEAFTSDLPEFPSLDNGATTNGDDDDDLSLGLPSPPSQPQQPIRSKHTPSLHKDLSSDFTLELVNQMAGDVITAAVTAAIQERIEAAVGFASLSEDPERSRLQESARLLELAEESDSEVEDFELLDQSELEQLEGELGLAEEKTKSREDQPAKSDQPGFFSKLLRRH